MICLTHQIFLVENSLKHIFFELRSKITKICEFKKLFTWSKNSSFQTFKFSSADHWLINQQIERIQSSDKSYPKPLTRLRNGQRLRFHPKKVIFNISCNHKAQQSITTLLPITRDCSKTNLAFIRTPTKGRCERVKDVSNFC